MVSLSTKLTVSGLSPPSFYATRSKVSRKRKKERSVGERFTLELKQAAAKWDS